MRCSLNGWAAMHDYFERLFVVSAALHLEGEGCLVVGGLHMSAVRASGSYEALSARDSAASPDSVSANILTNVGNLLINSGTFASQHQRAGSMNGAALRL